MKPATRTRMSQIKWGEIDTAQKLRFLMGFAYLSIGSLLGIAVFNSLGSEIPAPAIACMGLLAGLGVTLGVTLMRSVTLPTIRLRVLQGEWGTGDQMRDEIQKLRAKRRSYWWLLLVSIAVAVFAFLVADSSWWYTAHLFALGSLALFPFFLLLLLESARAVGYSRTGVLGLFFVMITPIPFVPLIGLVLIDAKVACFIRDRSNEPIPSPVSRKLPEVTVNPTSEKESLTCLE